MAEIAAAAGTGIGTLYRRYPSRDDLARELSLEAMRRLETLARQALDGFDDDPAAAFGDFLRAAHAERTTALGRLAGSFELGEELLQASGAMLEAFGEVVLEAQRAGVVRNDVTPYDVGLLLEQLEAIWLADPEGTQQLQSRHLELHLQALAPGSARPLPGPAPSWDEILSRWGA